MIQLIAGARRWLGCGAGVLLVGLLLCGPVLAEEDEGITLNFQDADLREVVALVSQETGVNFIVDPRVRGDVTIVSQTPVDADGLYQVFLSALKIHGFAAVPTPEAVRIIPRAQARQDRIPSDGDTTRSLGDQAVTRVIRVDHVNAAELVPVLRPLVPQDGHLAAYSPANSLIISDTAANVDRLEVLIGRVDRDTEGEIEVIQLEHAAASEVVRMVRELEDEEREGRRLRVVADERANSVMIAGDRQRRLLVRALIGQIDSEVAAEGTAQVVYLRFADAEELVPVLEGIGTSLLESRGGNDAGGQGLDIRAHSSTNALVMNGPADVLRSLRSVLNRLDIRRAQVLVEAVIAEVSQDRVEELGVQWGVLSEDRGVGLINFGGAAGAGGGIADVIRAAGAISDGSTADLPQVGDGAAIGVGDLRGSTQVAALIRALSGDSASNILSTPSLMTMDNEEAEIVVGQNVPFITGRAIEDSGQAFSSIQRQDVGVQLRIRPQINEGDTLKLEIEQEVSSVSGGIQGAADLVTDLRSVRTSVMVENGQMVVLGGLIDDQLRTRSQAVPLLGNLPGLGRLFRYDRSQVEKRNLMVFLRPVIIRDTAAQERATAEPYNRMRAMQQRFRDEGVPLMPDDAAPVLAESEQFMSLPPAYDDRPESTGPTGRSRGALPPPSRQGFLD
ncbi:type II secretion system secretin GspD [Alkalilimnicola ehrlichii MLHE-1]|uniref:General secretion pathway protein D n=1 Tax=Alkalilimnicola ehrlichii (strain ATCC BAA-1101 / DSM 17681 / MLHE-1) TaxID=187272 RepID=Q0A5Z6_ALKEH|nr:type II secretion system secretin GspD [Alkalilimnicola ehrlichii]ABI57741.1 general secretion pathway protein D [Alkalilimnicola ehrlichii MLHE-1]